MTKRILITGASKGIGKSITKTLAQSGYEIFVCARNEELLRKTAKELNVDYFVCDLTNEEECKNLIDKIGKIDILINNAGGYVWSPIEKTETKDISNLINLNIKAPYLLASSCIPHMKEQKWGRIVNIGSISGVVGEANASLYSMTKSALNGFTKALALELAEYGITVNTINPGWVETDLAENAVNESEFSDQEIKDMIPQRRFIEPTEIANLVKYIISDEAKGLTAQNISLCAGLSAG